MNENNNEKIGNSFALDWEQKKLEHGSIVDIHCSWCVLNSRRGFGMETEGIDDQWKNKNYLDYCTVLIS